MTLDKSWVPVVDLTKVVPVGCQYRTRGMPVALEVKCPSYSTGD